VHGKLEDARAVHSAILKAGEPFGIERIGMQVYGMNHTENGFPQASIHFMIAWHEDAGFIRYLGDAAGLYAEHFSNLTGSAGSDLARRYCNPVEIGWGHVIKFDHDFIGREALEKELAKPRRKVVTLVGNPEDVLAIYASHFETGEEYLFMEFQAD